MNAAMRTTVLMGILAGLTTAATAYYYPWPEIERVNDKVDKPLFDEYTAGKVRAIEITHFNRDRNALEQIKLMRKGEKWIVPSKANFTANNSAQIARAVNSLLGRTVYEMTTDNQQEHFDYGVIDPIEYQSAQNRSGLGTKIVLEDRNRKTLASLIVGMPVKNDPERTKRFVRIPGQPHIYVIDFDTNAPTTDFYRWVNSNLLQLQTQANSNGLAVESVNIDNYRIEPEQLASGKAKRQYFYRATVSPQTDRWAVTSFETPGADDNQWNSVTPNAEQVERLQSLGQLANIVFTDVTTKDARLAKSLANPSSDAEDGPFQPMIPIGYRKIGFENSEFQFDAAGGQVVVNTRSGVRVTISIGAIAGAAQSGSGKLNHIVMITAGVDQSKFPEPKKPAGADENPNSAENKAYLREMKTREANLKTASDRAAELNQEHSKWYYVCHEDIIGNIRPDLPIAAAATNTQSNQQPQPSDTDPSAADD